MQTFFNKCEDVTNDIKKHIIINDLSDIICSYLNLNKILLVNNDDCLIFFNEMWHEFIQSLKLTPHFYKFQNYQFTQFLQLSQYNKHDVGSNLWHTRFPNKSYHYENGKWMRKADIIKRNKCKLVKVRNDMFVLGGGITAMEQYIDNVWIKVTDVPFHFAQTMSQCCDFNGHLFIFSYSPSQFISFDPISLVWQTPKNIPVPGLFRIVRWDDVILLIYGNKMIQQYDPIKDEWSLFHDQSLPKTTTNLHYSIGDLRCFLLEKNTEFIF